MRSSTSSFFVGLGAVLGLVACSSSSSGGSGGTQHDSGAAEDGSTMDASHPVEGGGGSEAGPEAGSNEGGGGDGAAEAEAGPGAPANAVYTMSNAVSGNAVVGFTRAADGSLTPMTAPFATGGVGTGASLGEQGAVAYDVANDRVYAVNAGDDSFSFFPVNGDGSLGTAVKVSASSVTGGAGLVGPKSITAHGGAVYVLFEGDATHASAIAGWTVAGSTATAVAGSLLTLSSATQSVDPAQIEFSPDGAWLVVTEKQDGAAGAVTGSGSIDTFSVDGTGLATKKGFYATAPLGDAGLQMVPYGFAFAGSTLVVSEAGSTGVGTYTYASGAIAPVSTGAQFLSTDPAPCWVAVSSDWAYVANAKGPDVSGFTVAATGGLTAIGSAANAVVAHTGNETTTDAGVIVAGPTDEAVSADGKYLYVLDASIPAIGVFAVNADGTLTRVGTADYTAASLPVGAVGLAAR
jgi:6-phosphogluconolactonase (cycloisomerase 2 family)